MGCIYLEVGGSRPVVFSLDIEDGSTVHIAAADEATMSRSAEGEKGASAGR